MQDSATITRKSASNLALSFFALGREKRDAMAVLYAFCREIDDVADEDSRPVDERRAQLAEWREDVRRACNGGDPEIPVNREMRSVAKRYGLSFDLFDELIRGVEMDLDRDRYESWEELDLYCHRVASVVGLLSIEIFEYSDSACHEYAHHLGRALQLTNILRDIRNDAERGRIYLPRCELNRHRVDETDLLSFHYSDGFHEVAAEAAVRARGHYQKAAEVLPVVDRRNMVAAESMGAVYWRLLRLMEKMRFQVLDGPPMRLSKQEKIWLVFRTWWRVRFGSIQPNYGLD
ncbi:MAG: squalene synthase HpnD [Verrucomicrobiales bacterium]|nr:squalene synthase HpnD [Verrucomicrobiales bacterium]